MAAYADERPDPWDPAQRVVFGTSGHRGSSLARSFNEAHVVAITQAICAYRGAHGIDGPLFLGWDTHALSAPTRVSVLEVRAANGVDVMVDARDDVVPTSVISHAILAYNDGRTAGLADGIVITPSHNPPEQGGIKYHPPTGGPADTVVTGWIEERANALLEAGLRDVRRLTWDRARGAATMHPVDYRAAYVDALRDVIDIDVLQHVRIDAGIDPLGGASLRYWEAIGERHGLPLHIINAAVDPTFRFMTVDADGAIRMDPSSPYAMAGVIDQRDRFDLLGSSRVTCSPSRRATSSRPRRACSRRPSLKCIESALTGESEAVTKATAALAGGDVPLGDRANTVFMRSGVAAGTS